jgi:hypothetical protein
MSKLKILSLKNQLKSKDNINNQNTIDINELNLLNQCTISISNQNIMFITTPNKILVINNTIPLIHYTKLSNEYINLKDVIILDTNTKNKKILSSNYRCQFNINLSNLYQKHSILSPLWYNFIEYHLSNNFINKINNIFSSNSSNNNIYNLEIDFQIGYTLPIFNNNYYMNQQPQLIDDNIIYIGWYLMRKEEDNSIGGNLEIYNNNIKITSIPYQNNCLIILENKKGSKYTFSQKQITLHFQRYITFYIRNNQNT